MILTIAAAIVLAYIVIKFPAFFLKFVVGSALLCAVVVFGLFKYYGM